MRNLKAFTLIDCLMAILIIGLGTCAITRMILQYRLNMDQDWERQTAWEILDNLSANHETYLADETTRNFDFRGSPSSDEDKFQASIFREVTDRLIRRFFEVTWVDRNGEERILDFERLEWSRP